MSLGANLSPLVRSRGSWVRRAQDANITSVTFPLFNNEGIWIAIISWTARFTIRHILISLGICKRPSWAGRGNIASLNAEVSNRAFTIKRVWNSRTAIAVIPW